jgi:hypothetical protein
MQIEVPFNFIYTMHYSELVICLTFFNYQYGTWIEPSTFNMLKPLLGVAFYTYHNLLKHM